MATWHDVRRLALGLPETDDPSVYFTTPHFDGYPAVLARLDAISEEELEELVVEAWLCRAPKRLADRYAGEHLGEAGGMNPPQLSCS